MKNLAGKLAQTLHSAHLPVLAFLVTVGLAMCCSSALSQSDSGVASIQGTITDSTGAVLPNVAIHVVNRGTNAATNTKSNGVGFYQVPGLFTGDYSVTFTAPGFKTYTEGLELLVAQAAVINPVMTAGAVTEQVNVTATAQLTNPENSDINSTLENQRINQLPMNGRLIITLAQEVTPGIENATTNTDLMGFGGLPSASMDFVADGITTSADLRGGQMLASNQMVDPDAVQEVRVETMNASAQYAVPTTAIVTTKSGTNSLHGSFFETARNNSLGIAKSRANPAAYTAPQYVRNEFGASAGGPIILPHVYHGKDKSFWFFAYERYSLDQVYSLAATVPTSQMEQGNFSQAVNANIPQVIFDPSTTTNSALCPYTGAPNAYCRTPYSGNQIPGGEESPVAKAFYAMAPPPTSAANPYQADNYIGNVPEDQVTPTVTIRVDHEFNDNNRAYVRYTQDLGNNDTTDGGEPYSLANTALGIPAGAAMFYQNNVPVVNFFGAVGYTHVFSPTFFAETIAGQQWQGFASGFANGTNKDYESELGLPNNFGRGGLPEIGGSSLIANFDSYSQAYYHLSQVISNLEENLTKTVGKNQILFGGRFRHDRVAQPPAPPQDSINFNVDSTALYNTASGVNFTPVANTGVTDPSFFLGSASVYNVYLPPAEWHLHWNDVDAYIQDNYHVTKKLTANLGLRYEAHTGIWTKYGLMNSFDLKNDAMVLQVPTSTLISEGYTTQAIITNMENDGVKFETPAEAGMPANILKGYYFNFLPRVGLAYQPFGGKYGTVIRGAFGRYTFVQSLLDTLNGSGAQLPYEQEYTQSYLTPNQAIDAEPNELLRYNDQVQFGEMGVNTANVVNSNPTTGILPGINLWSVASNWAPNFVNEANFTIEQPLKGNSVLRASWVYIHATNAQITVPFNEHPSTYQWEMAHGTPLPTGTTIGSNQYAATATGPYDQTTWGSGMSYQDKAGWANTNQFQATYQRLFHKGIAYQVSYVYTKALFMGGDIEQGTTKSAQPYDIAPYADYPGGEGTVATMTSPYGTAVPGRLPPPPPTGTPNWANYHALNDWTGYLRNGTWVPPMHIFGNGIVDLPIGTGKRFLGNANRFVNDLVGGFQLAGDANILSQLFQPSFSYLGPEAPIHVYKHKVPITNCTSGVCVKQYLWFNGYIPPTENANVDCTTNCITGVPANYQAFATPIDTTPGTTYYDTEEVEIQAPGINGGNPTPIAYDVGPYGSNFEHTFIHGPTNWTADASIFKVLPITERFNLRFNMDVFNLFNDQGYNNPAATTGLEAVQPGIAGVSSYNTPRQMQLTLRLSF